jgi:hypothetical protein
MRSLLLILSILVLITSLGWWWKAGSNSGWTKTSVQVWKYDEITEIKYPETVKRFVPGVDFLAGAAVASLGLAGVSFVFRKRPVV